MKNSLLLVFIFSIFISCKSNTKPPIKDSIVVTQSINQTQEVIKKFKPIIQGVWVKSDYVDKVIKTKSPATAADEATGMTTMYINTDKITGDSILVGAGWNNHEGGELTLKFKAGKGKSTILFGGGELGYSIKNGDTVLTTYWPDEKKSNKIIVTNYRRVLIKQAEDMGYGIQYIINKQLISGKYNMKDSIGNNSIVKFYNDGKVSGFLNFKTFYINTDFVAGPQNNLDQLIFDVQTKVQKDFLFKLQSDTLNIYEVNVSADSLRLERGKLKYSLIRQK
ncbi:hypothetical protein [Mucilaginibacter lappiensis]|uniref:hypothetical protein n=1 Tax=Mucilaginibacter lappiensis TaxID=354630 RepID=UPI003D1C900A